MRTPLRAALPFVSQLLSLNLEVRFIVPARPSLVLKRFAEQASSSPQAAIRPRYCTDHQAGEGRAVEHKGCLKSSLFPNRASDGIKITLHFRDTQISRA